jgi:hypothetical protein
MRFSYLLDKGVRKDGFSSILATLSAGPLDKVAEKWLASGVLGWRGSIQGMLIVSVATIRSEVTILDRSEFDLLVTAWWGP